MLTRTMGSVLGSNDCRRPRALVAISCSLGEVGGLSQERSHKYRRIALSEEACSKWGLSRMRSSNCRCVSFGSIGISVYRFLLNSIEHESPEGMGAGLWNSFA